MKSYKDNWRRRPTIGAFKLGLGSVYRETTGIHLKGRVTFSLTDAATGWEILHRERDNVVTLDASILAARLFKDPAEPTHGINMLAIGSGATGALLSPNIADNRQRKLNAELARKGFVSTTFRDSDGNSVSYPTNIVDFTTTYGEAEAVGPLNEMGLMSTISNNTSIRNQNLNAFPTRDTTVDTSDYDVLVNYLTFPVISKPSTAILSITWRLSF